MISDVFEIIVYRGCEINYILTKNRIYQAFVFFCIYKRFVYTNVYKSIKGFCY